MNGSVAACAQALARGDADRFAAAMAAPVAHRPALFALGALNLELARAAWVSPEPMVCEMRLQWWVDGLEHCALAHEFGAAILAAGAPVAVLVAQAEARRRDCWAEPFESAEQFDAYLEQSAAGPVWATAAALGAGPEAEAGCRAAGWAFGLARLFLAVPDLEARGRAPLYDGRPAAVAALAQEGLYRLARAREGLAGLRGASRAAVSSALLQGWQARGILQRAAKRPVLVADGALAGSEFSRRAGLIRAALWGVV